MTHIIGPLRYANTNYPAPIRAFLATLPGWSSTAALAALVVLLWSRAWVVAALPFIWGYTQEHLREAATSICALADSVRAQGARAASRADEERHAAGGTSEPDVRYGR